MKNKLLGKNLKRLKTLRTRTIENVNSEKVLGNINVNDNTMKLSSYIFWRSLHNKRIPMYCDVSYPLDLLVSNLDIKKISYWKRYSKSFPTSFRQKAKRISIWNYVRRN